MIGEKLPQPVADDWGQNMRAFNTYGPAEATIVSTLREFGNEHKSVKSGNIGWPLKSVSVFVTREKKFVMKHAVVELALGGPQLSPGYLNRPETNKQKYVWNGEVNEVLYYTGDLVRMLSDSSLEYISRTDDLVKLGGIRVELSEISFSLRHCHPLAEGIETMVLNRPLRHCHPLAEGIETMVLNRPGRPNDAVVAFIAAPQAAKPGQEVLTILLNDTAITIARAAIRKASMTLPDHMKPSTFVVIPSIPKTQSAKVDRRTLQALYTDLDVGGWEKACNVLSEDLKGPAVEIDSLQDRYQSSYFQHPPWAVTIMSNYVERTMVFSIYHVLYDGQALEYILNDVYCAYSADAPIRPQLRDALSLRLCDYAEFDVPSWPNLTGERIIPEQEKVRRFITETVRLSVRLAQLETMATELGVSSVASVVRVAFGHILFSYLGSSGVVFAETLSDRVLDADIDRTIGPFISVVPVPFNSNGTVREVLTEQHRLSTQARKYRHIHPQTIRKLLKKETGEPLYPGVFTFHASNEVDIMNSSSGTLWNTKSNDFGLIVEHPMALNVFREPDGTVILEASSLNTIMSSTQLAIFTHQIDALVGAMLDNPDLPLRSLPSSIDKDLLSISAPSPSDAVGESTNSSPVRWIESTAEQHPEWTAVEETLSITEAGVEQFFMSYGELNASANRVAAYLSHIGIKNRAVALCSRRNLASYPVLVGIIKSGNAYLPIDEGLPDDRKAFLIEDGNAPIVFTETAFVSTFEGVPSQCRIVCIDEQPFQQDLLAFSSDSQTYIANPHDTAYILYTSGSTGKPKGVMITRANLSSFIKSLSEFVCRIAPATRELGGKGRWLGQASRAFDPHIAEMFFPWRHGMATSTGARSLLMDDLRLTLAKLKITHAGFVPSLLDQADIRPQDCPSLVLLSVGGEKIFQRVLDTWGCASQVAIMNAYGPTELTVGCSFAPVHKHSTPRNIGLPLTSCACHVLLPDTLDYALRGQTGELCFTGDLVGKGYLNRPDAKGFVIGPDQEKMYRTGDVGRIMADGSIEYLGRGDDQTKIRGQRLELGEVSEVIRTSSRASIDVVTITAKHPGLARQQLEDLSIIPADISTFCKDLRDICRQKLPGYMVPDIVLPVNRIPFAAMPDKIGIDSLSAINLSVHLRHIGLSASVALVMSNPVVEQFAHLSCKSNPSSEAVSSSEIQNRLSKLEELFDSGPFKIDGLSVASVRPCLPLQEGLVARSINSNSGFYVNHIALRMNSATDATRFQNEWQDTVKETEILRTVFVPLQSEIAQAVLDPDYRCDCTEAQYDDLEMAMTDFQRRQDAIGRNITSNMMSIPPLRILHAVTAASRLPLALFISIHHSLYDGASLGMLLQDFAARYLPEMAPPQRGSPETFIKEVCSQNIDKSESFWRQKLAGCKPTIFKKPVSGLDPHVHSRKLSPSLPDLESCAARMKSTLSSLVQAVFALTLADARWIKAEGAIFDCLFSFTKSAEVQSHDLWEEVESNMPSEYPLALEVEADEKNECAFLTCGFTSAFGQTDDAQDLMAKMDLILSTMISRNASFFSLGLDSVTAIRFSSQLRDAGVSVSSAEVMRFSCIGALAHSVVEKAASEVPSPLLSNFDDNTQLEEFISQVERLSPNDRVESVFKCSPLQTAMITETIESDGIVYIHPHIVKLSESTSVGRLKEVYRLVVMANDILRTSFHPVPEMKMDFSWFGAVHSDSPATWKETTVPRGTNIAQVVMQLMRLDTQSAFSTPPIQPVIVSESGQRLLVIIMHYALYDGVSLPFTFDDLGLAYQGASLPIRPPFANIVRSLSQDQTEACQFWASTFEGFEATPLPRSPHRQPSSGMFYSEADIELDMTEILGNCKEMEVTVQSVAILAYAKVLAKLSGK
ncbi:Nonribosomal peptide synthetase 2 [Fusarium coicis]|nr:Nonribosomal peptide synthetase 2 [Fusarium coicis]